MIPLRPLLIPALGLGLMVSGCVRIPGLAPPAGTDQTPALLTIAELQALERQASANGSPDPGPGLSGRAAGLKARASAMRGPVHDPETRARLALAISGS